MRHASPQNGHQQSRDLVIGDFPAGVALNQEIDLLGSDLATLALLADKINDTHMLIYRFDWAACVCCSSSTMDTL